MGDGKGSELRQGAFNREAGVKPRGPGARADSPLARTQAESPMFGEELIGLVRLEPRQGI